MAEGQGSSMVQADQDKEQVQIIEEEITEEKKSPFCENCVKKLLYVSECRGERERHFEPVTAFQQARRFEPKRRFKLAHWFEQERQFAQERRFEQVRRFAPERLFELERWFESERRFELERRFEPERRLVERWLVERVAVFLCSDCEMYVCVNCLRGHESHEGVRLGREESEGEEREINESERKLRLLWDDVMKESETESIEKFERSHVSIYDRVYVKHELDRENCLITGLCVLGNQRWVACDYHNRCIKIFTLGRNVLQRYIRVVGSALFGLWDVTEILVDQNSTEPNLASSSSSGVSVTDQIEQIAVTLRGKRQIIIIDLSEKPALIHKVIHTKGQCYSIQFYENKIFTVCREDRLDYSWCVHIYSTDGDMLYKFNTGIGGYLRGPYLAVDSGLVYLTDWHNNKVHCRNVEGQVLSEITMKGSEPAGISVGPNNNVYVCAHTQDNVYKLDADLTRYESVSDQTAGYIEKPWALCYYRDKLFISHDMSSSLNNVVTVVRRL